MPLYGGRCIHQFDAAFQPVEKCVAENEIREMLLRKQIFRLAKIVREKAPLKLEGKPVPESRDELNGRLREGFGENKFKLDYEMPRLAYREIAASTNERTLIAALIPERSTMNHKLMYLQPTCYDLSDAGKLRQEAVPETEVHAILAILNSLVANYYIRSRVSSTVSVFYVNELPLPKLPAAHKRKLADSAAKLSENPRDIKERATLEVFIARELYGLSLDDWKHLTSTFTFGSGTTKEELDEIIRQSLTFWPGGPG